MSINVWSCIIKGVLALVMNSTHHATPNCSISQRVWPRIEATGWNLRFTKGNSLSDNFVRHQNHYSSWHSFTFKHYDRSAGFIRRSRWHPTSCVSSIELSTEWDPEEMDCWVHFGPSVVNNNDQLLKRWSALWCSCCVRNPQDNRFVTSQASVECTDSFSCNRQI